MTIKSKLTKLFKYPQAVKGYFVGLNPNYLIDFIELNKFIKGDLKTYIDVGANVGNLVKTARYFYPNVKTYAFEPVPNIYNAAGEFFNIGLSGKKEELDFYVNKVCHAWSTLHKPIENDPSFSGIENFEKIKVKLNRFDNLDLEIEQPCLLKIDTEGHEFEVLEGFGERLKEVDVIQLEYLCSNYFSNKRRLSEIIKLLEGFGFNGMFQINLRYLNNLLNSFDLIFYKTC